MIQILIVDDKQIHRTGLERLILKLFPELIVFKAKNGKEALTLLSTEKIDVLITDIIMPVLDGIALLKNINETHIKIKIIILSAFGEFEYAKQAMKFGSSEYLLKPVDSQQLYDLMSKIIMEIEYDRKRDEASMLTNDFLEHSLPLYIDNIFSKYIRGKNDSDELNHIQEMTKENRWCTVVLIKINQLENQCYRLRKVGTDLRYEIKNLLTDTFKVMGHGISFFDQFQEGHIYHLIFSDDFTKRDLKKINEQIRHVQRKLEILCEVSCFCAFSEESIDFQAYNPDLTDLLEKTMMMNYYLDDKVFSSRIGMEITNSHIIVQEAIKDKLKQAIMSMDKQDIIKTSGLMIENLLSKELIEPALLKEIVFELVKDIIHDLSLTMNQEEARNHIAALKESIKTSVNLTALKGRVSNSLLDFSSNRYKMLHNADKLMIEEMLDFIKGHYSEDLSLQLMADMIPFSLPYFSTLFKCKTGVNFSKYLLAVRMEEAKKLLSASNEKIFAIANRVGYNDPKYFDRVFKKESGMTPKEYRKLTAQLAIKDRNL